MSNPGDLSASVLTSITAALKTVYLPKLNEDPTAFMGTKFNQMFKPRHLTAVAAGLEMKFENYKADLIRGSKDPNENPINPDRFDIKATTLRYAVGNPTNMDFLTFNGSYQVTQLEFDGLSDDPVGSVVRVAKRLRRDVFTDMDSKLAMFRTIPRNGRIALVNGNLINGSGTAFYTGTAYTASATDVRFKVDNGSYAALNRRGVKLVIYKSNGTDPVTCRTVGQADAQYKSIRVQVTSDSATTDFGLTAGLYNNGAIYLSGGKDVGMYGPEEWSTEPTNGEAWLGGEDRTAADKGYLNFTRYRAPGTTPVKIQRSYIEGFFGVLQYTKEAKQKGFALTNTDLFDSIRTSIGEAAFSTADPSGEDKYGFGSSGLGYTHPYVGRVNFVADPLVNPNKLLWLVPETWFTACYDKEAKLGVRALMGDGGTGGFYRPQSDQADGPRSKHYRIDFFNAGIADVCEQAPINGALLNLKP